jgi:hypothetical protein
MRGLLLLCVAGAAAVLVATGCSGDDGDGNGDAQQPETPASSDFEAGGSGEATASVTIGDEEFVAEEKQNCISMGGAVEGIFTADDGAIEIEIEVPPEDWETDTQSDWSPPSIVVVDERGDTRVAWQSGTAQYTPGNEFDFDDYVGEAVVESYTVDGSSASGTATFVDDQGVVQARADGTPIPEPVSGSFEISCG